MARRARTVEAELAAGRDVLLEIDWQGAPRCARHAGGRERLYPAAAPDRTGTAYRNARTKSAGGYRTRAATEIERRFRDAVTDISHWQEFDYVVVNDDFTHALAALTDIRRRPGPGQPGRPARIEAHPGRALGLNAPLR